MVKCTTQKQQKKLAVGTMDVIVVIFIMLVKHFIKKKTGELFVFGEGGAASRYAERCGGNSTCFGEDIIPLSSQDAKEWVERKLDADAYVELFGEVEE